MKLAAIDIGSNAIRFQITHITFYEGEHYFKRLEYVRFPLRLGEDAFTHREIKPETADKLMKLMHAFQLLIELYEVDDYYACATSAMREASNGSALTKKIKQLYGLKIHIIDGRQEAALILRVIQKEFPNEDFLHIDVGGGSTELNLVVNGKNVEVQSFKLGSVRNQKDQGDAHIFEDIKQWLKEKVTSSITCIGTGGNISKIYELSANQSSSRLLSLKKLMTIQDQLLSLSKEERIYKLHLNPDRADVIVPASMIYRKIMQMIRARSIYVPNTGLKDGIMEMLFDKNKDNTQTKVM